MRQEINDFLWQPSKKWMRVSFSVAGIAAWLAMACCVIFGWLYEPVVITSLAILGVLGGPQLLMSVATGMHGYLDDKNKD